MKMFAQNGKTSARAMINLHERYETLSTCNRKTFCTDVNQHSARAQLLTLYFLLKETGLLCYKTYIFRDKNILLHRKCTVRIFIHESQNFRNERVSVAKE